MRQPHVRGRPAGRHCAILPRVNDAVARKSHSNNCKRSDEASLNSTSPMIERGLGRPFAGILVFKRLCKDCACRARMSKDLTSAARFFISGWRSQPARLHKHRLRALNALWPAGAHDERLRSEEHTSELQSRPHLVCRLLLEKK